MNSISMRALIFFFLSFCVLSPVAAEVNYTEYGRLLECYVEAEGVRYQAWADHAEDRLALKEFLREASEIDVPALSVGAQKAFYINLYNAAMLEAVFEHWPIDSVKKIGLLPFSIFKKDFIQQGGRRLSLDEVEKGILLKQYFDPRIHFAVNCASESCPPLRAEPFVAARLDAQLDEQTRHFARSQRAARINLKKKSVAYSELFKWYKDDFADANPGQYLNRYRDQALPLDFAVEWIEYDWSLNSVE